MGESEEKNSTSKVNKMFGYMLTEDFQSLSKQKGETDEGEQQELHTNVLMSASVLRSCTSRGNIDLIGNGPNKYTLGNGKNDD